MRQSLTRIELKLRESYANEVGRIPDAVSQDSTYLWMFDSKMRTVGRFLPEFQFSPGDRDI